MLDLNSLTYRWAKPSDYAPLSALMHTAIHSGTSPYTSAQKSAWSPAIRTGSAWTARLEAQHILPAEETGQALGFMSLAPEGYVDFAYILPSARGSGLFRTLHDEIERLALDQGLSRMHTHASLMARPAFAACGYTVSTPESVHINGQDLKRSAMEKHLK